MRETPVPIPGLGYPLQYSALENSIDCVVHGITSYQVPVI